MILETAKTEGAAKKKAVIIIAVVLLISLVLSAASFAASYFLSFKPQFFNYYGRNIFYIELTMQSGSSNSVSIKNRELNVRLHLFDRSKQKEEVSELIQLRYSDGTPSQLYTCTCSTNFEMFYAELIDTQGNVWLNETKPTDIKRFKTYTLAFDENMNYRYQGCRWGNSSITADQFSKLFLGQFDPTINGAMEPYFSVNSYPNLSISFNNLVGNESALATVPKAGLLPGKNALEQWIFLKDLFLKKETSNE